MRSRSCHRSIIGPSSVRHRSVIGPSSVRSRSCHRSIIGPSSVHHRSIIGPSSVRHRSVHGPVIGPFTVRHRRTIRQALAFRIRAGIFDSVFGRFWPHFHSSFSIGECPGNCLLFHWGFWKLAPVLSVPANSASKVPFVQCAPY